MNANTLCEVSKIAAIIERLQRIGRLSASALGPVGLRINPLVGAGDIAALRLCVILTQTRFYRIPYTIDDLINALMYVNCTALQLRLRSSAFPYCCRTQRLWMKSCRPSLHIHS